GVTVANRTPERAARLAALVCGTAVDLGGLPAALAGADLVISCTGAAGTVITAGDVAQALRLRAAGPAQGRPLVLLDLALPRDAARVAPTVVALRAKAAEVVEGELARLSGRLGPVDARTHEEIARALRRVVDKLLHAPTVRVKELAGSPGGDSYEAALRVLFDLDPGTIEAVTRADASVEEAG